MCAVSARKSVFGFLAPGRESPSALVQGLWFQKTVREKRGKSGKSGFGCKNPLKASHIPHFTFIWIQCDRVSYFVQGLRRENLSLRSGSTSHHGEGWDIKAGHIR